MDSVPFMSIKNLKNETVFFGHTNQFVQMYYKQEVTGMVIVIIFIKERLGLHFEVLLIYILLILERPPPMASKLTS